MARRIQHSVEFVRQRMARLIVEGYFPVGKPLPRIQDLAEKFGVALVTAQQAVHRLAQDGLVVTKRGAGVFLSDPATRRAPGKRSKRGRRPTVGLVHPFEDASLAQEPYPQRAVNALRTVLKKSGYELEPVSLTGMGIHDETHFLRHKEWAGLVLFEVERERMIDEAAVQLLPTVSMDFDAFRMGVSSASYDNLKAGFLSARSLMDQGHRRVALIRFRPNRLKLRSLLGFTAELDSVDDDRIRGYRLAMDVAGEPATLGLERRGEFGAAIRNLMARQDHPTALICMSQDLAERTLALLNELGYRVPAHISVNCIGASDEPVGGRRWCGIGFEHEALGRAAAELLLDAWAGRPPRRMVLPVSIRKGQTSGPASMTTAGDQLHLTDDTNGRQER